MGIRRSVAEYEAWLADELGDELLKEDLTEKHDAMREDAFQFLRATYWRWAEQVPELCEGTGFEHAPRVLAVGDIHLENFGTWRDADGRLVWGVNDFDEAAEMPYALDLVRLATSAFIAGRGADGERRASVARAVLDGYREGLAQPQPWVLDGSPGENNARRKWLREQTVVSEDERLSFWDKLEKKRLKGAPHPAAPARFRAALLESLPAGCEGLEMWPRRAGLGSLGRPRWVARVTWRGGLVLREAKAALPSAWSFVNKGVGRFLRSREIATGRYRAPDPWFALTDGISVRRLSPNNRKIEASGKEKGENKGQLEKALGLEVLLDPNMLGAMGHDLAAIHLGAGEPSLDLAARIRTDLADRGSQWLEELAAKSAQMVQHDWEAFRKQAE